MARLYDEIESTAGLYGPAVYAEEISGLLTHFHDLTLGVDSEGMAYTPMTSVKEQTKLFAVGVLPPSAKVTGKVLDRSAVIATREGVSSDPFSPSATQESVSSTTTSATFTEDMKWGEAVPLLSNEFWIQFVAMCRRIGVDPVEWASIVFNESGFNPAATNWGGVGPTAQQRKQEGRPVAVGINQFIWSAGKMSGMTREEWDNHRNLSPEEQLYWMEAYLKKVGAKGHKRDGLYKKHFGGTGNPDGSAYASIAFQDFFVQNQIALGGYPPGTTRKDVYINSDWQQKAYDQNSMLDKDKTGRLTYEALSAKVQNLPPLLVKQKIAEAEAYLGNTTPPPPGKPGGSEVTDWSQGSKDAQTSQTERWKSAGVPLNQTELGQKLQATQRQAIAEAKGALEGMARVPPLRLLVNPKQFSVKGSKITSDGNWSRRGPVIEHWGDEQDVLSASGKVAAFYTMEMGLSRVSRQYSQSWRNFYSLYLLYKNNGGIYLRDPFDPSGGTRRLTYVGSVYIFYDGILYIGSFNNFSITEGDTSPFSVEYSFEFNVRAAFMLDQPDSKYDVSYSYQNTNKDQPKPPLPTKTQPDGSVSTPEEVAKFEELIAASKAREQEEIDRFQSSIAARQALREAGKK